MKEFCCRCKEDFPVDKEPKRWTMGQLRELSKALRFIREKFKEWLNSEIHGKGYLCGNCYFDLLDEEDARKGY